MAIFRKRKSGSAWNWDPVAANIDGDQAWALLTNAVYFQAAARRLDTLGGGLQNHDWVEGLATWWDVRDTRDFDELVQWMTEGGGYRRQWTDRAFDGGESKVAWDYCRLITVSGGAALAGVIPTERAWQHVLEAGDVLSSRFASWKALSANYLAGRLLWLQTHGQGDDSSQLHFVDVADRLLTDPESPWNRVDWERDGGVVIDGELVGPTP